MSDNELYIMAVRLLIPEPESPASLACSMYASLPALTSVNSLTMPFPKFAMILGRRIIAQQIMIIDVTVKIRVLASFIFFDARECVYIIGDKARIIIEYKYRYGNIFNGLYVEANNTSLIDNNEKIPYTIYSMIIKLPLSKNFDFLWYHINVTTHMIRYSDASMLFIVSAITDQLRMFLTTA